MIKKLAATTLVVVSLSPLLSGCSSQKAGTADPASAECAAYKSYQGRGGTVTMYSGYTEPDDKYYKDSWKQFEQCTGITIKYTADKDSNTNLKLLVVGGNAPDLTMISQPGLVQSMVETGKAVKPDVVVEQNAKKYWNQAWYDYGSVNGTFYAAPTTAVTKSTVWYSPKAFKQQGLAVPKTWDAMMALSDKVAGTGQKPWCIGIEAGTATGWPTTDWLEELVLRKYGQDLYDQWVSHKIPFNDPRIADALDTAGAIVKNDKYVNGGIGDVKSIATTAEDKAGLPILKGKCSLLQSASSYAGNWPTQTSIGPGDDSDVFTFYLPPTSDKFGKPTIVGGDFLLAFADRPEVQAVQEYLSSPEWATSRVKTHDGWVSANKGVSVDSYSNPVDRAAFEMVTDPKATVRFDGSDLMPAAVGAGSFWTQMTKWTLGQDTKTTLDNIEQSWPKTS